ncbi:MAG: CDP-alcohol phosphatidyltransferase family protein, partial [Actinomycetia bacterium]|nr:CDP-alcohol phosphatidyltransferase family protein [Actinomycetes bacterium]
MIKSWANVITFFRILLIPVFLFFLLSNLKYADFISASIFSIAALSDALDGYLARLRKEESKLGKYFDPLADQLLVTCALIGLVGLNILSVWIAFVFISRELIIS